MGLTRNRGDGMARTLNPQLFGPSEVPAAGPEVNQTYNPKRLCEIEDKIEILSKKIAIWMQASDSRQSEAQMNQKALSEQMCKLADQVNQQQSIFKNKFNERKSAEAQSQVLIDRHQQIVQNFESRLDQLQKVTREQELKIKSYQATYDEILREIRNIKRY